MFVLFNLLSFTSFAQQLDRGFQMPIPVDAAYINDILIQPDGKILVGGDIKFFGEKRVNNLIRLNPDGTLDETFSFVPDAEVHVKKIGLLSSGEIIIGGRDLIKLSPSGQILNRIDFLQAGTLNIQDDDKIIVTVDEYDFTSSIYRYDKDLHLDPSFDQTNSLNSWIIDAALQNDKLIVTGTFSEVNGISQNILARFNADGSWDESFKTGLDPSNVIINITVLAEGKIIFTAGGIKGITRLNADGTTDPSFSTGPQVGGSISHIALKDGSILVAGHFGLDPNHQDIYLYKVKSKGELDQNFTPVLLFNLTPPESALSTDFLITSDSSQEAFFVNTTQNGNPFGLSKFDNEGQVAQTFKPEVGRYGEITCGDEYHGQIIVGGRFLRMGGIRTTNIAKINTNGSVDSNFTAEAVLFENAVSNLQPTQIKIVHDDTILVAMKHKLQRLNGEGKVDEQFISQGITAPALFAIRFSVLNNGKIVTASDYGVFMLNADGSEDLSFSSKKEVIIGGPAHIGLQPDGIVYTTNTARDGTINTKLYKVLLDGSKDETFTTEVESGANSFFHDISILENDAILGTGGFTQYRGEATKGLVKFFKNGQLDENFVSNYNATVPESFSWLTQNVTFRKGSIISASGNLGRGYTIGFLNADGTYNTDFSLPEEVTYVRDNIFSLVLSPDSIMLLSRFELSGQDEPSFAIRLTFDDRPVITGTTSELSTLENTPVELKLSDFTVTDKDSSFPNDFSLIIQEGENYTVEGSRIIPDIDFYGKLTIPVVVNDGKSESDVYNLSLKVIPVEDTIFTLTVAVNLPAQAELPSGTAILYQKIEGKFTAIASKTLANALAFDDLPEGEYTVVIKPTDHSLLKTYLGNELTLWEAKTINLQQDTVQSIALLESTDSHTGGGCIISGVLRLDPEATTGRTLTGNTSTAGEVLADVPVYLVHPETRSVLANHVTDEKGRFSFTHLAVGDYLLIGDYEGIPLDDTQNLVQIQTNYESISITVIVGANIRITDVQSEKLITAVDDEIVQHTIRYYPNPTEDKLLIEHGADWVGGELRIHNIIGSLVGKHSIIGNITELQLEELAPGIYFISLVNGKSHYSFKIHKR